MTNRLLAPVALQGEGNKVFAVDASALVTRLLLFPTYILQSVQLDELPLLIRLFGERGLIRLFEVGALKILFETYTLAQLGQARADLNLTGNNRRLPLGSYSFSPIRLHRQEQVAEKKLAGLGAPLGEVVRANLISMPVDFSARVFEGFYSDLRKNPRVVKNSVQQELQRLGVKPTEFEFRICETAPEDFLTEGNFQRKYGLSDQDSHRLVERALLAIGDLNLRLIAMSSYQALTGVNDRDKPLLEGKFEAIAALVDSSDHQGRFGRVTDVVGLHTIAAEAAEVDAEKLIKIRDSQECLAFRDWLRTTDSRSDAELRERLVGLNAKIRETLCGMPGKLVRFILSGGLSMIATPLVGLSLSAIDSFLIDHLAQKDAIVTFLSESYPSLFRRRNG